MTRQFSQDAEDRFRSALQRRKEFLASKDFRLRGAPGGERRHFRMDMTWITARLALGGGIWNAENMADVARAGITHIIDMQIEFDDTQLAQPHGIEVLWNPTDDDFQSKPADLLQRGVDFAAKALADENSRLLIHCAAGVHRAAMMTLAVLCSEGWDQNSAMHLISARRPVVDFAAVYVESVGRFLQQQVKAGSS